MKCTTQNVGYRHVSNSFISTLERLFAFGSQIMKCNVIARFKTINSLRFSWYFLWCFFLTKFERRTWNTVHKGWDSHGFDVPGRTKLPEVNPVYSCASISAIFGFLNVAGFVMKWNVLSSVLCMLLSSANMIQQVCLIERFDIVRSTCSIRLYWFCAWWVII